MKRKLRHPIRAIREPFGKAGLTVAILALVFAMVGGAYAASGGLNGKQKKEVEKIAKKYAGKPGATGPAGAAGKNGNDGTNGTNGGPGSNGVGVTSTESNTTIDSSHCVGVGGSKFVSASGTTYTCNGKNGTTGFTKFLPKGSTETGAFSFGGQAGVHHIPAGPTYEIVLGAISFNIPLQSAPTAHVIAPSGTAPSGCEGSVEEPGAEEGNLCIFVAAEENVAFLVPVPPTESVEQFLTTEETGAGPTGVSLLAIHSGEVSLATTATGTFAVTAE
jgi:hypothetical protein